MVVLNNNYTPTSSRGRTAPHATGYKVTLYLYAKEKGHTEKEFPKDDRFFSKEAVLPIPPVPGLFINHKLVSDDDEYELSHKVDQVGISIETGEILCNLGDVPYLDINEMLANGWRHHFTSEAEMAQEPAPAPKRKKPRKRLQTPTGQRNGNEIKQIVQG